MIEAVGYTDDGQVWISMLVQWNGMEGKIVANFSPDQAVDLAGTLAKASEGARKALTKRTIQ